MARSKKIPLAKWPRGQVAKGNIVKRDVVNIENWLFVIYAALIFIYQFINLLRAATTTK